MVPQVGGQVDVGPRRASAVEEEVAGPAAEGDGLHALVGIPRDPDAVRGLRQHLGDPRRELAAG